MNEARLWPKIVAAALNAEAEAIHLEPETIRFKHQDQLADAFELTEEEFENLFDWLEILGEDWQNQDYCFKTYFYPSKAVVRIFKKSSRYLENLKGLYFVANPRALEEILNYLAKNDLRVVSFDNQVFLNPERGLTASRALDYLEAEAILFNSLEDREALDKIARQALTGKLVLINRPAASPEEAQDYLQDQGLSPQLVQSIWQGIIK